MQVIAQDIKTLLDSLRDLKVDWQDDTAKRVITSLEAIPIKPAYTVRDVEGWLNTNFDDGLLICRLFLGLSKDQFTILLRDELKDIPAGVTGYKANKAGFLDALLRLGLLDVMAVTANRASRWSDVLVERLRSGRGSAISGQQRGRGVEDFVESVVKNVFGTNYAARVTFTGQRGHTAKCDIAIPSKNQPRIVIEAKAYGATGSKQTDVLGDILKIIEAKRQDTAFLFFTDGLTWRNRQSDLQKIIDFQNAGDIMRIYTYAMEPQLAADLRQLKKEYQL
jgi:hypothetical protein